jgi:hypothetical protein
MRRSAENADHDKERRNGMLVRGLVENAAHFILGALKSGALVRPTLSCHDQGVQLVDDLDKWEVNEAR